ncbi:MAG: dsbD [Burkholderiales bacterium]|jgi:thiol:disulfide interchange protein DsbD|nr:dsbD [Burkholderiales bacterium]
MKKLFGFICLLLFWISSHANILDSFTNSSVVLSPEHAFSVSASFESATVAKLHFDISPGFYIYKDRLEIKSNNLQAFNSSDILLPSGVEMNIFNGVKYSKEVVLNNKFDVFIKLRYPLDKLTLLVRLFGCDGKTVCYPPQDYKFELEQPGTLLKYFGNLFTKINSGISNNTLANPFKLFIVFFLAGIAISLTPCVYPLYPIALSAISKTATKKSNVIKLAMCYIHGISLIYVLMGVIAAFSGYLLITLIQTPIFVLLSSMVFLILGLSMFDLLEIKLPSRFHGYIHTKSAKVNNGGYISAFILGFFSSFLLGPCVTPPLIIAISYIASKGSVISGVLGLYAISLGMGMPILILSTAGSKLLPKSGPWLNGIKYILGFVIIAVAIYMAYPLINIGQPLLGVGVLCFVTALAFLLIKQFRSRDLELLIHTVMPILMIIIGLAFIIIGSHKIANETVGTIAKNNLSLNQLNEMVVSSNKPVIIIVSAKWCAICRELEATTFKDKEILEKFKQYTVINFDITENKPDAINFLRQYKLYGPPAIIIFAKDKKLKEKISGYISAADLSKHLNY